LEHCVVPHGERALAEGIHSAVQGNKPPVKDEWLDDFRPETVVKQFMALC